MTKTTDNRSGKSDNRKLPQQNELKIIGRLASAIRTPTKDMQTTTEQDKQGDKPYNNKNEESSNFGNHYDSDNSDNLATPIEELMELEASGSTFLGCRLPNGVH